MNGLDYSVIWKNGDLLAQGLALSLALTVLAAAGGMLLGVALAIMRVSGNRAVSWAAAAYVDFIRGIPLLLVIFWLFFLVPLLIGRPVGPFYSALVAFTLFEGAYYCEVVRAAIGGVRSGQRQAGLASGLSEWQVYRHIVLPQALRNAVPALVTQSIVLFQDTSLVYIVTLRDFVTSASIVAYREFRVVEMYTFVAAVFLLVCVPASLLVERLNRRRNSR
jgi:glutamate/aspartate transport system permease protein